MKNGAETMTEREESETANLINGDEIDLSGVAERQKAMRESYGISDEIEKFFNELGDEKILKKIEAHKKIKEYLYTRTSKGLPTAQSILKKCWYNRAERLTWLEIIRENRAVVAVDLFEFLKMNFNQRSDNND